MKIFLYFIVCLIALPLSSWGQLSEIELMNLAYITETPYPPEVNDGNIMREGKYAFYYNFDELVLGKAEDITYAVYNEKRQILRYYAEETVTIFTYDEAGKLIEANEYGSEDYDEYGSENGRILRDNNLFFLLEKGTKGLKRLKKIVYKYNSLGQIESLHEILEDGATEKQNFVYDSKRRIAAVDDMKLVYDETNQLVCKYFASSTIHFQGQEGIYQEGVKYVYQEGSLTQKFRLYKSTLRMSVKIPEKNINESMPLTPELTNAAWSIIRPGISMKVYSVKNPQWDPKISEYYEYENRNDGKQVLQKVYIPDYKKDDGRTLNTIYFWEYLHTDSIRQKQNELLEIERQKRIEAEERKKEELRLAKEREKQKNEELKQKQEEIERQEIERQICYTLKQTIRYNHNELSKLYIGGRFAQLLDLDIPEQKFKKPKLYMAYLSLFKELDTFEQSSLRDLLTVQKNMQVLRKEKTKEIEKRLSEVSEKYYLLTFLKDEAMKLKGR